MATPFFKSVSIPENILSTTLNAVNYYLNPYVTRA